MIKHSEVKTIRCVSSKSRASKAVSQNLKTTFTHMEQIISTSNPADELGQAKAILNDLKQVKGSLTVWALYAYFSDSQNAAFDFLVWCM